LRPRDLADVVKLARVSDLRGARQDRPRDHGHFREAPYVLDIRDRAVVTGPDRERLALCGELEQKLSRARLDAQDPRGAELVALGGIRGHRGQRRVRGSPFVDDDLFQAGGQRLGHLDVGLDLEPAQVTSLVEASGGTIEICNRPPGGACVSISLPTAPRTKAARD
jgi:hypothetical protein